MGPLSAPFLFFPLAPGTTTNTGRKRLQDGPEPRHRWMASRSQAAMRAEIIGVKGTQFYMLSDQVILLPEATAHHSLPSGWVGDQGSLATWVKTGSEMTEPGSGEKKHDLLANAQGQEIKESLVF